MAPGESPFSEPRDERLINACQDLHTDPESDRLALVYKLSRECERKWRRLNSHELIDKVIRGIVFNDGLEFIEQAA